MSDSIDTTGLPDPYTFDTDVIEYIINTVGQAQYVQIVNRSNIIPVNWAQQQTENLVNFIFGTITNAYVATTTLISNYLLEGASIYGWDFSFTGSNDTYPGWETFGTAYGFSFKGVCGDIIDLVLDSQGNFYGHNPIGNYTIDPDPEPYNWILINQGLDNFYVPINEISYFSDLKPPYIEGKSLHFFYYYNGTPIEFIIEDFTDTSINATKQESQSGSKFVWRFYSPYHYTNARRIDNANVNLTQYRTWNEYHNQNLNLGSTYSYVSEISTAISSGVSRSYNLPFWNGNAISFGNYNALGFLNDSVYLGSGNIYLKSFSYTPNTNPNPIPEDPIPVTSIPENPEDPIPQTNPDPVPGITYPEPAPLPLPPFASIVSGNDELWGVTLDFDGAQNSLLPYLNSLAMFEFPSFDDLISDFSGSIIWVAQLMSVLYNGTSFNVLFVVLCLFSLVSIIIGGYKLWTTTEPDPNNPGFRRTKRPPKGPKGRSRR